MREVMDAIPKSKKDLQFWRKKSKMVARQKQGDGHRLASPANELFNEADEWQRSVVAQGPPLMRL
jgi:DNA topoisomerase IB